MAAPTPDTLYDFLAQVMGVDTPDGENFLFELDYLITRSFRHFHTTSNAVRTRFSKLVEDGRIVPVEVAEAGYVHFQGEDREYFRTSLVYFQYHQPHRHARENYGPVTINRSSGHDNVWRSGVRDLYVTRERYDLMIEGLRSAQLQKEEAARLKEEAENRETEAVLNKVAPDAVELLKRLQDAVPSLAVRTHSRTGKEGTRLFANIEVRGKGFPAFLDILRRGLPDVPRETKED